VDIKPSHDLVVVKRIEANEQVQGEIIIPDTAKEKHQQAEVIAVGPGKLFDDGKRSPMDVKAGDHILMGKYSGSEVKLDDEPYVILPEAEILGVIDPRTGYPHVYRPQPPRSETELEVLEALDTHLAPSGVEAALTIDTKATSFSKLAARFGEALGPRRWLTSYATETAVDVMVKFPPGFFSRASLQDAIRNEQAIQFPLPNIPELMEQSNQALSLLALYPSAAAATFSGQVMQYHHSLILHCLNPFDLVDPWHVGPPHSSTFYLALLVVPAYELG
jgi:chaperonin GroES